jgi:hypothetical protein
MKWHIAIEVTSAIFALGAAILWFMAGYDQTIARISAGVTARGMPMPRIWGITGQVAYRTRHERHALTLYGC